MSRPRRPGLIVPLRALRALRGSVAAVDGSYCFASAPSMASEMVSSTLMRA